MPRWLDNWLVRHRHPASLVLHLAAIPMLPLAVVVVAFRLCGGLGSPWSATFLLVAASYLMQWLGHRIEGNDMGEVILIKKLLRRPYVAVAHDRRAKTSPAGDSVAVPDEKAPGTVANEARTA